MEGFIRFVFSNFTLSFFVIGIICALISLMRQQRPLTKAIVVDRFFSYFLLCPIGIASIYNFVMHVFYGKIAAQYIGWADSPFQAEVGFASLGFGIVGILAFARNISFRSAAIIGPAFFFWGAAGGHIYQMVTMHNFAPGNAGVMFWTDVIFPIIGFWLLRMQYKNLF